MSMKVGIRTTSIGNSRALRRLAQTLAADAISLHYDDHDDAAEYVVRWMDENRPNLRFFVETDAIDEGGLRVEQL